MQNRIEMKWEKQIDGMEQIEVMNAEQGNKTKKTGQITSSYRWINLMTWFMDVKSNEVMKGFKTNAGHKKVQWLDWNGLLKIRSDPPNNLVWTFFCFVFIFAFAFVLVFALSPPYLYSELSMACAIWK